MFGNDGDDGALFGIEAPSLTIKESNQDTFHITTDPVMTNTNSGHSVQDGSPGAMNHGQNAYAKGYVPTPRDWHYEWNATPRNPQV